MQHIKLKPNATRKETYEYSQDVLNEVLKHKFSGNEKNEFKNIEYKDGKYYTSATKKTELTGIQAYFLMKTIITNLLNTRVEFIPSDLLAICINMRLDNFHTRHLKPLLKQIRGGC